MPEEVKITSVEFSKYKAFSRLSVSLRPMNIVVGPNNSGKSTLLGAFRILVVGIKRAWHRNPESVHGPDGNTLGHYLSESSIPISLENVHTNYDDVDSLVTFRLSNRNYLQLFFPSDGGCVFIPKTGNGKRINRPVDFRSEFPISVAVVPVLGPVEHKEPILDVETVKDNVGSPRASRHFRNYWHQVGNDFDKFANLVSETWPGMEIEKPERVSLLDKNLAMYCYEDRIRRELAWCGSGFQVWCHLLTHISRVSNATLVVVDEPEIYLHPDVQRQLIGILRRSGPDVLLATHSTEIMSEADPDEILILDKKENSARRLRDIPSVQEALDLIGSAQNLTLTALARNKRIIFVEDIEDYKLIRKFAHRLNLPQLGDGEGITPIISGGFSSWEKVVGLGWGLDRAMKSSLFIGVIYDRDYWCDEEITAILLELRNHTNFAHVHLRKEIENYLLVPSVLDKAIAAAISDRAKRLGETIIQAEPASAILERITNPIKSRVQGLYAGKRTEYLRKNERLGRDEATILTESLSVFDRKWQQLESRLQIIPGKEILQSLRTYIKETYSVNLSDALIVSKFRREEIPQDLSEMIVKLDEYRSSIA